MLMRVAGSLLDSSRMDVSHQKNQSRDLSDRGLELPSPSPPTCAEWEGVGDGVQSKPLIESIMLLY